MNGYDAQAALAELVDRSTNKNEIAVDQFFLQRIKRACRDSDASLRTVFDLLFHRLGKPHSQVRLLALQVAAELFQRSALFRSLLAAKFPRFLELVLGHRVGHPLPAPTASAAQLRQRGLELVERWHRSHGARLPQITLGHAYLRGTLRFEFPQLDARQDAADAAQRSREARSAELALERLQRLLPGWAAQAAEARALLQQFDEAFALLEEQRSAARLNEAGSHQEDGNGIDWEDVEATGRGEAETEALEGIAAYAPDAAGSVAADFPLGAVAAAAQVNVESNGLLSEADAPLIETLDGLHKLICAQALPGVAEALQTVVRSEGGDPGDPRRRQRDRVLREATLLKAQLAAAKERFEGAHLDLAALTQAQGRRQQRAQEEGQRKRETANERNAQAQATPAAQRQPQRREAARAAAAAAEPNPYAFIRDPTAPRHPFHVGKEGTAPAPRRNSGNGAKDHCSATATATAAAAAVAAPSSEGAGASLPASVRQSLAALAPVLPAGAYTRVWDSGSAAVPQYVSGHALDVSNHWGPVDVNKELPSERMEEMFLYDPATRNEPREQQQQQEHEWQAQTAAKAAAREAPGAAAAAASLRRRAAPDADTSAVRPNAASFAPLSLSLSMAASGGGDARRAQRAAERAYNDAVISAAAAEAAGEGLSAVADPGEPVPKKAATKKRKESTRERLNRKLLSGRAKRTATADAMLTESEKRRDTCNNSWG